MIERFKSIFSEVTELPALISHKVDRVEGTRWMHRLINHRVEGPKVWRLYLFSLFEISVFSQKSGNLFTYANAGDALWTYDMAVAIKRMYCDETGHFKSLQYKNCGSGGMEAFGNPPCYGWGNTFLEKIRPICLLELGTRLKTKARVVLVGILK
ncbi:TPA: hypothetical protein F3L15_09710 [Aeromonas hydrophila]|uniref:hypothetical protein n=1 Tax=Aeromonas hydrophila TaxID=644 RepID=UPI001185B08B|nr:hypothetical protein [Aeromonas hydrophila]HAU4884291.1 hypothetical protein [Aeromonas hydrophila]